MMFFLSLFAGLLISQTAFHIGGVEPPPVPSPPRGEVIDFPYHRTSSGTVHDHDAVVLEFPG